jgi:hypothetical protein
MKFLTLKNKEINIDILPSDYPIKEESECKSKGQFRLGQLLQQIYGRNAILLEDFTIPESRLSLDFYLPHYKLAFEFQGVQHDGYSKFFHKEIADFFVQKKRDAKKRLWCDINNIVLVEVRANDLDLHNLKILIYD